jgi:hypothetical protein
MTATEITNIGNFANALSAAFTAYIAVRSLYIWYKYLSRAEHPAPKGTMRSFFQNRAIASPPPSFPTWDLIIATSLLVLSSLAGALLYVWSIVSA